MKFRWVQRDSAAYNAPLPGDDGIPLRTMGFRRVRRNSAAYNGPLSGDDGISLGPAQRPVQSAFALELADAGEADVAGAQELGLGQARLPVRVVELPCT